MENFTDNGLHDFTVVLSKTNRKNIGGRLREAREKCGLSLKNVENFQKIKIKANTLQQWETAKTEASIESIIQLAELYNVSPQYLIFGEEENNSKEKQSATNTEYDYIPVYNIEVSAGHGMFSEGAVKPSKHLAFRRRWIEARNLDASKLSAVFTTGDSMEPTIPNGAAIIVDHQRNKAMDGKIYVIRIDDRLWVKRVQWTPTGGLKLISDNQLYETFEITRQDLKIDNNVEIIGQVIHASYDLPD